ncbi:MAG: HAD family phosphatase [Ruminococcaceae bacterium]|nr:HAD family phosphatase [Oscillospiraceae bacterium]
MIKNYIFDFGNVLAEFEPEKLTAPFVSDEKTRGYLSEIIFDRIYWDRLDDGTITDGEIKAGISSRVPAELVDTACKVYDNWVNSLTPVKGMAELVSDLRKGNNKLFLLSNISVGFADTYNNVDWIRELLKGFDGLVLSGPIGITKPSADIFNHLLEKYGLNADECLFIDDSLKNIEGAKACGIHGYLFDGDAYKLRAFVGV